MTLLILDDDPDVALAARLALRRLGPVAVRPSISVAASVEATSSTYGSAGTRSSRRRVQMSAGLLTPSGRP